MRLDDQEEKGGRQVRSGGLYSSRAQHRTNAVLAASHFRRRGKWSARRGESTRSRTGGWCIGERPMRSAARTLSQQRSTFVTGGMARPEGFEPGFGSHSTTCALFYFKRRTEKEAYYKLLKNNNYK